MKKTFLITTSTCHKCDDIKEWLKEQEITNIEIIVADEDRIGRHMGVKLGIEEIPIFVETEKFTVNEFKNKVRKK
jgi:hypothetical protein